MSSTLGFRVIRVSIPLALALSVGLHSTANAQLAQQGHKLVGTGAVGNAAQGFSVAVSSDGNTAIVGGQGDNSRAGAAWVYTRAGGVWTQQGGKLSGTGALGPLVGQGFSVALSADGNTAIVGGPHDNFGAVGAAWVFTRTNGAWSQQGAKLAGADGDPTGGASLQGWSVALSADGNTALVGGPLDHGGAGAAWVYTRTAGVWSQQGSKLVGTGAAGSPRQGNSVALSADGNTAIVGGPLDNGSTGAVWMFTRTGGAWSQQGSKLVGTGAAGNMVEQGYSVALSADGNTAIVGGRYDNGNVGATWAYTRSGSVWSQQGGKLVGSAAVGNSVQGSSLALSADGNKALIGGFGDNGGAGATWVFARNAGAWSQQGDKLVGSGTAGGAALQGNSVALSGDGNTAVIGGPGDNAAAGAAWVFVVPPSVAAGGVVNGASFLPGIAPGTWISIFGSNLSATTRSWIASDFVGNNLPTQLDGIGVTIDARPAYVYYISPTQLNVLAPDGPTLGPVAVQVTSGQLKSRDMLFNQSAYSPALFASGRYAAGVGTVKPGDVIQLFGTGFGATNPPSPIGQIISTPAPLAASVIVHIGGVIATTQFTGIVVSGVYQFNVVVPDVPNGDNAVVIDIGGTSTQPNVFLAVQR